MNKRPLREDEIPQVTSLNREHMIALLDNGEMIRITNELTYLRGEVAALVAGPSSLGLWYSIALDDFEPATIH